MYYFDLQIQKNQLNGIEKRTVVIPYFACFQFRIAGTVTFSAVMCSVSL